MYAHGYNLRFSGKNQQNTNHFLSDISCGCLSFVSDTSSFVGHILHFLVIFVGHILLRTHLAMSDISSRNEAYYTKLRVVPSRGLHDAAHISKVFDCGSLNGVRRLHSS